jgi:hypothetical protein
VFGAPAEKGKPYVFTATFIKTKGKPFSVLMKGAPIPLEEPPARPPELAAGYGETGPVWVEGAEWMYAGASPTVCVTCSCPTHRAHLDWYKRSYVPEAYRHSIGILDTNGNLVMHLGSYGNHDDALAMKPGTTDIRQTVVRFISGTDNYLCFEDNGARLTVVKLNYQAEESVGIGNK